jgi:hypothetical protein
MAESFVHENADGDEIKNRFPTRVSEIGLEQPDEAGLMG